MATIILTLGSKKEEKENFQSKRKQKEKKENSRSKIGRKQKKYAERSWDQTISDNIELSPSKQEKERKPQPKVVLSLRLQTKILCASDFLAPH